MEFSSDKNLEFMVRRNAWQSVFTSKLLLITFLIIISVVFVPSLLSLLNSINANIQIRNEALNTLPELKKELTQIDIRMKALQNSDIGKRLGTIEKALKTGNLNKEEIKNLSKLTEEINVIQSYLSKDVNKILELREIQKRTLKIDEIEKQVNNLVMIKNDLSNFKTTTYLIAGILFSILFGSWFLTTRQKQSYIPVTKAGGKE